MVACAAPALAVPALAAQEGAGLRVVMLGTGTPNPDPERSGPAVLVLVGGTAYLVDAGPGVVRRAAQAARGGEPAAAPGRIGTAFLTHLHSDHTVGLPDLIHTGRIDGRTAPLEVYGPPGTSAMVGHLTAAFAADIDSRERGLEPPKGDWWRARGHDIGPGVVHRDSAVVVRAFAVPHANWPLALGYRFEAGGRSIVISGDARPSEAVVAACGGCDVLVHEVYSAERWRTRPVEWQRYHADAHTSTVELAAACWVYWRFRWMLMLFTIA